MRPAMEAHSERLKASQRHSLVLQNRNKTSEKRHCVNRTVPLLGKRGVREDRCHDACARDWRRAVHGANDAPQLRADACGFVFRVGDLQNTQPACV